MSRDISQAINPQVWGDYLAAQTACMPGIPDVQRVSSRVIRIQGGNPGEVRRSASTPCVDVFGGCERAAGA